MGKFIMKIKKFNEKHIHYSEDGFEYYEDWVNPLLARFFNEEDFNHSEIMEATNKKDLVIITEFDVKKITPELLFNISEYLKFVENHGEYKFYSNRNNNEQWIGVETFIYESKFPEELKTLKTTKKYNL